MAAGFEAIITLGLVLMIVTMANGPKLSGPFVALAVGTYIMAWGTKGGPHDRASMNPAGSFGPDTWVGFVSSGDPGWDRYTTKDRATMVFNTHNTLVNDPHGDERQLWDGLR